MTSPTICQTLLHSFRITLYFVTKTPVRLEKSIPANDLADKTTDAGTLSLFKRVHEERSASFSSPSVAESRRNQPNIVCESSPVFRVLVHSHIRYREQFATRAFSSSPSSSRLKSPSHLPLAHVSLAHVATCVYARSLPHLAPLSRYLSFSLLSPCLSPSQSLSLDSEERSGNVQYARALSTSTKSRRRRRSSFPRGRPFLEEASFARKGQKERETERSIVQVPWIKAARDIRQVNERFPAHLRILVSELLRKSKRSRNRIDRTDRRVWSPCIRRCGCTRCSARCVHAQGGNSLPERIWDTQENRFKTVKQLFKFHCVTNHSLSLTIKLEFLHEFGALSRFFSKWYVMRGRLKMVPLIINIYLVFVFR